MTAPTFFGKGALADEASGSTIGVSPQITFPASIAANDIAVIGVGCNNTSTFTTPGGGWAVLGTSLESDAGQSTEWYWLRLTGSETALSVTASATFSSTIGGYGQLWVFRGCITSGNPFEGVGTIGTVSETTPDSSACTTTGPDRLVVCIAQLDNDTAFASGYPPAGWTDRGSDASTTGADWRNYCMDRTEASATTVASAVVGTLGASTRWRTITFALLPVPDATVTPAVIARSFAIPQAAAGVGAAPAVITRSFVIPQVTADGGGAGGGDATATPEVIARAFIMPQVAVGVGAAPAATARAFSIPQVAVSVAAAPAVIARAFVVNQVAVSVGVTPAVIARAFALPAPVVTVGAAPALIALAFAIPQAIPDGGAAAGDVTVTPELIALAFALPSVTVIAEVATSDKPWKLLGGGPPMRGGYHKYNIRSPG